jgi:predicted nuclease of predicted toxin-antitoxin system
VTFYLDENLSPRIAEILRGRGLDVTSAHEVGNAQLDDRGQLRYAAGEGRAIVTCDILDFTELAGEFVAANMRHAGVVLVAATFRTDEFSAIAEAVEQVAQEYPGGLADAVVYLRRSPH